MIAQVIRTTLCAFGLGVICQFAQLWLGSGYLTEFLTNNLINILVALLAVNSATMGIVLTKLRELIDKYGHEGSFRNTQDQFLLAVKEQVALIGIAILSLIVKQSKFTECMPNATLFLDSIIAAVFIYAIFILYDTAKGLLIILDRSADV